MNGMVASIVALSDLLRTAVRHRGYRRRTDDAVPVVLSAATASACDGFCSVGAHGQLGQRRVSRVL